MKKENKNLIHIRIAARRYGLPINWLRKQAKSGEIPALIAENQVLFDAQVLHEHLALLTLKKGEGDE